MRFRMPLPHDNQDPAERYSMADPDALQPLYESAYRAHFCDKRPLTDQEMAAVLTLAGDYLHLTMYALGQTHCVAQLRDVWRARRAAADRDEDRDA